MKNHHHSHPIHIPPTARIAPPHEAIAVRAFELWARHGHPENQDEAIWLEAEGQLAAVQPVPTA
jgi:hypothetical protein